MDTSSSALLTSGPEWAHGCEHCQGGIILAPQPTRMVELHMERLVQAIADDITFCTCQAGTRYRVYLLNRRQILIEEARKDPRMAEQAARLSHPELDIARHYIYGAGRGVPSMHFEETQP